MKLFLAWLFLILWSARAYAEKSAPVSDAMNAALDTIAAPVQATIDGMTAVAGYFSQSVDDNDGDSGNNDGGDSE